MRLLHFGSGYEHLDLTFTLRRAALQLHEKPFACQQVPNVLCGGPARRDIDYSPDSCHPLRKQYRLRTLVLTLRSNTPWWPVGICNPFRPPPTNSSSTYAPYAPAFPYNGLWGVARLRYRYSVWDPIIFVLLIGSIVAGIVALRSAPESVPLHYNAAGEPDRWGEPSAFLLIGLPLLMLLTTYPVFRGIDLYMLATKPEKYGFMTNVGGGTALLMGLIGMQPSFDILFGFRPGVAFVLSLCGVLYAYMGILFRVTPSEKIPWSMQGGFVSDTPEARAAMAAGMGTAFIVSGLLTIPLAFLPGEYSLFSLGPMTFGPLVGLGLGIAKAPKTKRP